MQVRSNDFTELSEVVFSYCSLVNGLSIGVGKEGNSEQPSSVYKTMMDR